MSNLFNEISHTMSWGNTHTLKAQCALLRPWSNPKFDLHIASKANDGKTSVFTKKCPKYSLVLCYKTHFFHSSPQNTQCHFCFDHVVKFVEML